MTQHIEIAGQRDTTRRYSARLWGNFPFNDIVEGFRPGYARHYEFTNLRDAADVGAADAYWADGFNVFGSTGAPVAELAAQGGGATFGSDGDNEGASIRMAGAPFQLDRDKGDLIWEVCLQTSTVADTKHGFLVGLSANVAMTATDPITAAGAVADRNVVAFHRLEGDGDQLDVIYKADGVTQVNVATDILDGTTIQGGELPSALVAATDIKLGMRYFPSGHRAGDCRLAFYVNGIELPETKEIPTGDGTDFPNDVRLGWFFALLNATASSPGTTTLKWLRVAQLYDRRN